MRYIVFDIETQDTFMGAWGDPASLSLSVVCAYDSGTDSYGCYTEDELPSFWPLVEQADMLVGFNSNHFDIPILNKYYPGDLKQIKSLDLLEEVKKSLGRRLRLDTLAQGTLGKAKSGNGLQAITWWKQGEIGKIKDYCRDDVEITKEVFEYALKHKQLKYKDGLDIKPLKLDTSKWLEKEEKIITYTLPL